MSRLDVPTLQCDKCKNTTQDLRQMSTYAQLQMPSVSGTEKWDICPFCTRAFLTFMNETEREA